jgi:oligoendopeptidase F
VEARRSLEAALGELETLRGQVSRSPKALLQALRVYEKALVFYDLNYVYASLLALDYYALYKQDPTGFPARYAALMEHGFDATPPELLKKYLGIDFEGRKLVADALRVLQGKMGEVQ